MLFQTIQQQRLELRFVRCRGQLALGVSAFQVGFLVRRPLPQPFLGPLAATDRLEPLVVALKVNVTFHENLLHFSEQADDVICELGVVAVGGDQFRSLARRLLDGELVQLRVGIAFKLRPRSAMQEEPPVLADERPDSRAVHDARGRREQTVDDVRVVLHRQLEELHDAEDGEVEVRERRGFDLAVQAEVIGPGIQKNKYELKEVTLRVFNVLDVQGYRLLDHTVMLEVIAKLGLESVPQLGTIALNHSVDELVAFSEGTSVLNPKAQREGVVLRPLVEEFDQDVGGRLSFKAINPKFLLKYDE